MATRKKKAAKAAPEENTEKDESEKKASRAPRQDYGYRKGATIHLTDEAENKKYRGKRGEYFEILKKCDGKSVEDFDKKCPDGDPPRGWLRFFVQDGAAELEGGEEPQEGDED